MHITVTEHGIKQEMDVQDMGERKNAYIFLNVLNQFDPFIHIDPVWVSEIGTGAILATMYDSDFAVGFGNATPSSV